MTKLSTFQLLVSTCFYGQAALATPTARSSTGKQPTSWTTTHGATCAKLNIAVPVQATNLVLEGPRVDSNLDAVTYAWDADTWSHPNASARISGTISVNQTFNIAVQLCVPSSGVKSEILQIATHGAGFDKR